MKEWKHYRMKDICTYIGSGTTPKSSNEKYYTNGIYNWVNTGDLNNGIVSSCKQYISDDALTDYPTLHCYPKGTIIEAMYGATIGKVGMLSMNAFVNQACCAMVLNEKIALPKFILYYLIHYKDQLIRESFGGTQPNVNQFKVSNIGIYIPHVTIQEAIVSYLDTKLSEVDRQVSLLTSKRDAYLRLKKSIINRAVTKGLNPNVKMKDSGVDWIGEVPEGWEVKRMKDICDYVSRGITPDYIDDGTNKVMNQATFSKGWLDESNVRYTAKKSKSAQIKKGDLLMASTGGGVLGKIYYFNSDDENFYADSHVTILRNSKGLNQMKYLYYYFYLCYDEINATMVKGSTNQTELQKNYLLSYELAIPPLSEQHSIATYLDDKCSKIDLIIANLDKQISKYGELKRSLIDEVITGKRAV